MTSLRGWRHVINFNQSHSENINWWTVTDDRNLYVRFQAWIWSAKSPWRSGQPHKWFRRWFPDQFWETLLEWCRWKDRWPQQNYTVAWVGWASCAKWSVCGAIKNIQRLVSCHQLIPLVCSWELLTKYKSLHLARKRRAILGPSGARLRVVCKRPQNDWVGTILN